MKNAILLHGRPSEAEYYSDKYPSPSNSHWFPWLQKQLLNKDILAQAPEVFKPYAPRYENYLEQIERLNPGPETVLVGHSCGAGMIVQWLSKNPTARVGKVVLVAPWIDIEKEDWPAFDFEIDENLVARTAGLIIFHSTDDHESIQTSVPILREKLKGAEYVEFQGRGHFTHHYMPDDTFPELLLACLE